MAEKQDDKRLPLSHRRQSQTKGEPPCPPRSSFPTTAPQTRTTRSPWAACSPARAPRWRSPTCATPRSPTSSARSSRRARPRSCSRAAPGCSATRDIARHVVTDRSTPRGLSALAESEGASVVVFCSDSHTAHGHVSVGNSAQQLLEGGPVAVAIAPVGLADGEATAVQSIVAIGDADGGARATARGARRRAGRVRRAGRQRRRRPARRRLAPGGRAGPRGDQRLGGAPRGDRDVLGARAAARRRRAVRPEGGGQRLALGAPGSCPRRVGGGLSESAGRRPPAVCVGRRPAPAADRARRPRDARAGRSTATSPDACVGPRRGGSSRGGTVSWRR